MIHDDDDSASGWTHAVCMTCWRQRKPDRAPVRVADATLDLEACCFCQVLTESGVYVRAEPAGAELLCTRRDAGSLRVRELARLIARYRSGVPEGESASVLWIDNDATYMYESEEAPEPEFRMHPVDLLEAALTLLGIPHEHV